MSSSWTPTDPTRGVVIFRVELREGRFQSAYLNELVAGPQEVRWRRLGSSELFDIHAVSDGARADFWAELPAGRYWMLRLSKNGVVTSPYEVIFDVLPNEISYAGMIVWQERFKGPRLTPYDEYEGAVARFRASHPNAGEVKKSLLALWLCRDVRCDHRDRQSWEGPAHVMRDAEAERE